MGIFTVFKRTKSCLYFIYPFDLSKQAERGRSWLLMRFGLETRHLGVSTDVCQGWCSPLGTEHGGWQEPEPGQTAQEAWTRGISHSRLPRGPTNPRDSLHEDCCPATGWVWSIAHYNSWRPGGMVKSALLTKKQKPLKPSSTTPRGWQV